MFEGLVQPVHLLLMILLLLLFVGGPIWFALSVVTSLKRIDRTLEKMAQVLPVRPAV